MPGCPGAPTHRNLRRDTLACPNDHPHDLPALSFSTGTPASPPEGSITLKTKPDRRGTPSPADHFYQLTGIPFPPVPGSSAMHNPRSMIHDLASTPHDSRSAPQSPICNLRCSVNSGVPGKTRGGTVVSFGIPACLKDRAVNSDVPGLCAVIRGSLIEHRRLQIGDRGADRESGAVGAKSWIMDRGLCIAGEPGTCG